MKENNSKDNNNSTKITINDISKKNNNELSTLKSVLEEENKNEIISQNEEMIKKQR